MARLNRTSKPLKKLVIPFFIFGVFILYLGSVFMLWSKFHVQNNNNNVYVTLPKINPTDEDFVKNVFPVGVNSVKKEIIEDPAIDLYVESHLSINTDHSRQDRWLDRLLSQLTKWDLYQQLASPSTRILIINPGERKEEVTKNFGDILRWNKDEIKKFESRVTKSEPFLDEGKFFPGRYVVEKSIKGEALADILNERFTSEILDKYDTSVAEKVPLNEALIIASLLEREAYDFTDMRYISGIIWNRMFIDMPLQLDATLQYARGSKVSEAKWWPTPNPADKYLKSPYNTYKNAGLPPTPIANPSVEAVVAALNPRSTECMFYLHDTNGGFHCTKTYKEHIANIKKYYGQDN